MIQKENILAVFLNSGDELAASGYFKRVAEKKGKVTILILTDDAHHNLVTDQCDQYDPVKCRRQHFINSNLLLKTHMIKFYNFPDASIQEWKYDIATRLASYIELTKPDRLLTFGPNRHTLNSRSKISYEIVLAAQKMTPSPPPLMILDTPAIGMPFSKLKPRYINIKKYCHHLSKAERQLKANLLEQYQISNDKYFSLLSSLSPKIYYAFIDVECYQIQTNTTTK